MLQLYVPLLTSISNVRIASSIGNTLIFKLATSLAGCLARLAAARPERLCSADLAPHSTVQADDTRFTRRDFSALCSGIVVR